MTIKKNIFFTRSGIQQPVMNKLKPMTYFQTKSDFGTFLAIRITVLESITGWVKKSLNSSKMVFNHLYQLPGIFKIQFGPIFGLLGGPFLGSEGKKRPKNQNCSFFTIFHVENFFEHNFFQFFFLNGNYI